MRMTIDWWELLEYDPPDWQGLAMFSLRGRQHASIYFDHEDLAGDALLYTHEFAQFAQFALLARYNALST